MPIFSCSAILFDLDGVLVDSTRAVDREWREWARRKGVDGNAVMAIAHGVRMIEVSPRVAPRLDADAEAWEIENEEANDQQGVHVMPGAVALERSIPEGRWGVVTSGTRRLGGPGSVLSGPRVLASARWRFCGLPVPKVLVTAEDVSHGKPHPEPYLKGAELLGFRPADCLVIEDAPAGIQSARVGGFRVIGITSTYPASKVSDADAVVAGLEQIQVRSNGSGRLAVEIGEKLCGGSLKSHARLKF